MISGITSAKIKLIRAGKHLRAIKRAIAAYTASKPHKIVVKTKRKKKLNVPKGPPREISILIGEMVYQMRSALDHLAFELVKINPNIATIDPKWYENSQFPLRTKIPKGCTPPLAKSYFSQDLPGVSDAAFTFIESIQPYYGVGTLNNYLRFLVHLSNIDKHRRLNLTRPRVRQYESVRYPSGLSGRGFSMLDRGAEINPTPSMRPLRSPLDSEPEKPMHVNRRYRTLVAFNERDALGEMAISMPINVLLDMILYNITTHVVPAFEKFIKKP